MERMRDFFRDHGMVCALILCAAAAIATGVWAVRTVQQELENRTDPVPGPADSGASQLLPELEPDPGWEDATQWETGMDVDVKAEGIPERHSASSLAPSSGQGSSGGSGSKGGSSGGSAAVADTLYAPPVSGSVIKAYSGDELVYSNTLADWRTHNGTDYACANGSAVKAPAAGSVTKAETDGNWGGVVEITDSEGRIWRICGTAATVKVGDTVTTGQQIGTANTVHCEVADGTHVHLEVLQAGKYLDPAGIIG